MKKSLPTKIEDVTSDLLTVKELASILGVSRFTVYDRMKDGTLGIPFKSALGPRSTRFTKTDVEAFLGTKEAKGTVGIFIYQNEAKTGYDVIGNPSAVELLGLIEWARLTAQVEAARNADQNLEAREHKETTVEFEQLLIEELENYSGMPKDVIHDLKTAMRIVREEMSRLSTLG